MEFHNLTLFNLKANFCYDFLIFFDIPDFFYSIIGTSSLRRVAQLKRKYPELTFQSVVSFHREIFPSIPKCSGRKYFTGFKGVLILFNKVLFDC